MKQKQKRLKLYNMSNKVKISVIDFLPEFGKHKTGEVDQNGKDICYGNTVLYNGGKHLVAYRYGRMCLKQPFTIHTIGLSDYTKVEVLNEVTAAQDYLIIGYDNEPFIQSVVETGVELS